MCADRQSRYLPRLNRDIGATTVPSRMPIRRQLLLTVEILPHVSNPVSLIGFILGTTISKILLKVLAYGFHSSASLWLSILSKRMIALRIRNSDAKCSQQNKQAYMHSALQSNAKCCQVNLTKLLTWSSVDTNGFTDNE